MPITLPDGSILYENGKIVPNWSGPNDPISGYANQDAGKNMEDEDNLQESNGGYAPFMPPQMNAPQSGWGMLSNFLQSPHALGLASGLLNTRSPYFSDAMGAGFQNIFEMEKNKTSKGLGSTFGKAFSDYQAILNAYGPNHEMTKLAQQNLERIAEGSQGIIFGTNPDGTFTAQIGGSGKKGVPGAQESGKPGSYKTPPTAKSTQDVQTQAVAEEKSKILRPYIQPKLIGSGSNTRLANIIYKAQYKPETLTQEDREDITEYLVAKKLVSYAANLNLIAELGGSGGTQEQVRKQEKALTIGWPKYASKLEDFAPADIIAEATKKAEAIKSQLKEVGEKEYITGYEINVDQSKVSPDIVPQNSEKDKKPPIKDKLTVKDVVQRKIATKAQLDAKLIQRQQTNPNYTMEDVLKEIAIALKKREKK